MIAVCTEPLKKYRGQIDVTLGIPTRSADRARAMMALKDRV